MPFVTVQSSTGSIIFSHFFCNNNEVLAWVSILGSCVNVLTWSKRCVALYFCVYLHCRGHEVVCMCYVFVCIVAWHHLNNAFPWKGAFESQKVWVSTVYAALSLDNAQTNYKWKIQRTTQNKTIIQKYETRNSSAVSVNSFCKLVFSMHVCRCEFEPSTLQMYYSACVLTVKICAFICYQVNCHF